VILQETGSNLWTLGIKQESALLIWSLLESFSKVFQSLSMRFVISMREVKSSDIHASVKHLDEHLDIPACWSIAKNIRNELNTYPMVQMTLVFLTAGSSFSKICLKVVLVFSCLSILKCLFKVSVS
jgi:hypothetical protein